MMSKVKGREAEKIVARQLVKEGYVMSFVKQFDDRIKRWYLGLDRISGLLENHPEKDNVVEVLADIDRGHPDILRLKDERISFIEVKSGDAVLTKYQKDAIERLKNAGYETFERRIIFGINGQFRQYPEIPCRW